MVGIFKWLGFKEGTHTQTLYRIGELLEVVMRRDSTTVVDTPYGNCIKWKTGKVCKCFPQYTQPKGKTERCMYKSMLNQCLELHQSDDLKCALCDDTSTLDKEKGKCLAEKKCEDGCRFCTTDACLVCDEGYLPQVKNLKVCVNADTQNADKYWKLNACKRIDLRGEKPECYECSYGYLVISAKDKTCRKIDLENRKKLLGCRIAYNKIFCDECLPGYKQISDDNSWCHTAGTNSTLSIRKSFDSYEADNFINIENFQIEPNTKFLLINSFNLNASNFEMRPFELYISTELDKMPYLFFNLLKETLDVTKVEVFGVEEASKTIKFFANSLKCAKERSQENDRSKDSCYDQAFYGHVEVLNIFPFYLSAQGAWNYTMEKTLGNIYLEDYISPDYTDYNSILMQVLRTFSYNVGC